MNPTDFPTPKLQLDALVIGAGISGLSLAHALKTQQPDLKVWVCERQNRVGGNITTNSAEGFLWEEGPTSFSPAPEILKLAVQVGLTEDLVLADRRLPRYVYWQGKLLPVPMSPPSMIQSSLLSPWGKIRAGLGAIGFVPPAMGQSLSEQGGEETVDQFFRRHLGADVTERLVAPFVSGVYAGDPGQLSAAAAFGRIVRLEGLGGSLVAGAIRSQLLQKQTKPAPDPTLPKTQRGELGSFKGGITMLPEAIAHRLAEAIKLNWQVVDIRRSDRQTYLVAFDTPEGSCWVETKTLALTTPAHVTADLVKPLQAQVSQALQEIPYPPVACVVVAYPQTALRQPLRGFGNLIPRNQGVRTLGTIWSSSLFPGRAPAGWQLLTNFIGGATDPAIATLSEDQIVQAVHQDLSKVLLQADAPQPKVLAVHLWRRAIPQYTLGHHQRLAQIEQGLTELPGLFLCSNYIDGVALGDCVKRAMSRANDIQKYLSFQPRATAQPVVVSAGSPA